MECCFFSRVSLIHFFPKFKSFPDCALHIRVLRIRKAGGGGGFPERFFWRFSKCPPISFPEFKGFMPRCVLVFLLGLPGLLQGLLGLLQCLLVRSRDSPAWNIGTAGLLDCWAAGLLDCLTTRLVAFGMLDCWTAGRLGTGTCGPAERPTSWLEDGWSSGLQDTWIAGLLDYLFPDCRVWMRSCSDTGRPVRLDVGILACWVVRTVECRRVEMLTFLYFWIFACRHVGTLGCFIFIVAMLGECDAGC